MELNKLTKIVGNKGPKKRIGRGHGSGKGFHTVGRGQKGQKSRVGYNIPMGFEGGQVPLYKKLPKLGGFKNSMSKEVQAITLSDLNKVSKAVSEKVIDAKVLFESGIIKYMPKYGVKILGNGSLSKKLTLKGFSYSKSAKATLEKSGCKLE